MCLVTSNFAGDSEAAIWAAFSRQSSLQRVQGCLAGHGLDKWEMCNGTNTRIVLNGSGPPLSSAMLVKGAENYFSLHCGTYESVIGLQPFLLSFKRSFQTWGNVASVICSN